MKKTIFIYVLILLAITDNNAQNNNNLVKERITIFSDRNEYIPGENIWFNAFINNKNKKNESKIVYTELISPYGFSVSRKKLPVISGSAEGSFITPDTLSTGYYTLIAYTNLAKSISSNMFEEKKILIYNPEKHNNIIKAKQDTANIFTIETRDLVDGLKCRINYKANLIPGFKLIRNKTDTIIPFKNEKLNYIEFTPFLNNSYILLVDFPKKTKRIELPSVKQHGLIFDLDTNNNNFVRIRIQSTEFDRDKTPFLFLDINNSDSIAKFQLDKKEIIIDIKKTYFSKSNNLIQLKNAHHRTLWECEVINHQVINTPLEIEHLAKNYNNRTHVSFLIKLSEKDTQKNANLCVTIRKAPSIEDVQNNNFSYKQTLHSFNNETRDSAVSAYWENYGPVLWGKIIDYDNEPVSNLKVYLSYIDSVSSVQIDETDNNGDYKFIIHSNKDVSDIVLNTDTNEEVSIVINHNYLNNYDTFKRDFYGIKDFKDFKYLSYLNKLYLNHRINKVYRINYQNEQPLSAHSGLSNEIKWKKYNFYTESDKTIFFDDYILLDSIQEYFHEFFPSVIINNQKGTRTFKIVNNFKEVLVNRPAIFIDGVLYHDNEILFAINPEQCDRMEVVKSDYLIYDKVYGGLICLYTKGHDLNDIPIPKNSLRIMYKLYDQTARFKKIEHKNNIPDFRNLLYWESNIHLKSNDSYTIDFVTGDDKSKYEVVIFGFTNDGQLINESRIFEVN